MSTTKLEEKILVAYVLGSISDYQALKESGAFALHDACGVPYDVSVKSAHRNPKPMRQHVRSMLRLGTVAFVAAAGMAAHLPGAIAAETDGLVPVFGVPLDDDAVVAMQPMPGGRPVHVQSKGKHGFLNAAIGAMQCVALAYPQTAEPFATYMRETNKQPIDGIKSVEIAYEKTKKKEA